MNRSDIAYFLGHESYIIQNRFNNLGKVPRFPNALKQFGSSGGRQDLTYRLSSKIYHAEDLFSDESKADKINLLDIRDERVWDYALEHRKEIEPVILDSLKILYPEYIKDIKGPYVDFKS